MALSISCALAPSIDTPQHVEHAESLGYHRAWIYDSPAFYHDPFIALARSADRTRTIGLGTGVMIPSYRHPMDAAASIASLVELAPGRVVIGIGAGFSGRAALGLRPLPWKVVEEWALAVQGLLHGDQVQWDGATIQMLHPEGFAPARPIEVPWYVAAEGPRGYAVAERLGASLFSLTATHVSTRTELAYGTVLYDSEAMTSERVIDAAGPPAAVVLHAAYERGARIVEAWSEDIDRVPAAERHLAVHAGHLVAVTERDRPYLTPELITSFTFTGSPAAVHDRIAARVAAGVTEVAYQPAGRDIPRELDAFYTAVEDLRDA
jgi:5,10-methylenetetrahydromethanopterin reductase